MDRFILDFFGDKGLTPREIEICGHLIEGRSNAKDLAKYCEISENTITNHIQSIFKKMGTSSKTELVTRFYKFALSKVQESQVSHFKTPNVLILDDEPDLASTVAEVLSQRGLKTWAINDPKDIEQIVNQKKIDFIFSDIQMHPLDGFQALKALRANYPYRPLALFMTGYSKYLSEDVIKLGAIGIIEKPLDFNKVYETIMQHFLYDIHEGNRSLRIPLKEYTAQIPDLGECKLVNLGYGGVFIGLEESALAKNENLVPNSEIKFQFQLGALSPVINTRGLIMWKRPRATGPDSPAGIGVRFIELDPTFQEEIENFVRYKKISSFIPTSLQT